MRTADGQAITTGVATGLGEAGFMALMRHSESLQLQGGLPENSSKNKKRILFLKNEPGKLLKTNDQPKKRTGNEPETKLPKSLKIKDGPKKRTGNKPENEAGHVVENKRRSKNKPEKPPKNNLQKCAGLREPFPAFPTFKSLPDSGPLRNVTRLA